MDACSIDHHTVYPGQSSSLKPSPKIQNSGKNRMLQFRSFVSLLVETKFKIKDGTHRTFLSVSLGLKITVSVCVTCVVSPFGKLTLVILEDLGSVKRDMWEIM